MASNPSNALKTTKSDFQFIKTEVEYKANFQKICNNIYAASDLDEILIDMRDEITSLFESERLTIYVVDGIKRVLISRFKSGDEVEEIRIPLSTNSISGYSALKQKLVNIEDVYNKKELGKIDKSLRFDASWDEKSGFRTKEVLAVPIVFKTFLLGAVQLINRKNSNAFSKKDEQSVIELAHALGIALYNQKRLAQTAAQKAPTTKKFDYLLENHILTQKELNKAMIDSRNTKEPIENYLMKNLRVPKQAVGQCLSNYYNVPFVQYNKNLPIPTELLMGLKIPFMRNNIWVPVRTLDGKVIIAIDNPHDLQKVGEIKSLFPGKKVQFNVAFKDDILDFIKMFTQDEKEIAEIDDIISQLEVEAEETVEMEGSVGEEDSAVVQLVNKIILDAYSRNASDIHIEPFPGRLNTRVRIRVDGSCAIYQTIPFNYKSAVISRIKIMADLDIAERRLPQDGKIKFKKYGGKDIELRVATIPTQGGVEDVVMRILHSGDPIPLDKMGFSEYNYQGFVDCITQPYGLIFVCGPTGSGKTTTLHSGLAHINKSETKIWTAEDPVEITQKGLRQVQVKSKIGFTFAAAMRSFLRADPDVIMVGEMRDEETTHIGIEASLTGHLVLSTLHTNSAPESITRLLDMGMDPFNFADAILCILAQRLVRTLCKECKQSYHPTEPEFNELVREYGGQEYFDRDIKIKYTEDLTLNKPQGCDSCNNSGYKGRMGIHELLTGTDEMKKLVQVKARMEDIRAQAEKDGMKTLKQDGVSKIFGGFCDLREVRKVCIK